MDRPRNMYILTERGIYCPILGKYFIGSKLVDLLNFYADRSYQCTQHEIELSKDR